MLLLENKYIALIWWATFMLVLPWDQEKIVVVNLIVFCYFLYYMVSQSLKEVFEQRKQTIRQLLLQNINNKIKLYSDIISEIHLFVIGYSKFILAIIAQLNYMISQPLFEKTKTVLSNFTLNYTLNYILITQVLATLCEIQNKNLVTSHLIVTSIEPSASHVLSDGAEL